MSVRVRAKPLKGPVDVKRRIGFARREWGIQLVALLVKVPARTTVTVKCTGRGCPKGTFKKRTKKKTTQKKNDPAQEAIDLVIEITEALSAERGDGAKLWGSMIKQTLKRRRPGFNESFYGFESFSDLLEEAAKRKQLDLERDEKSGGYIVRGIAKQA